MDNHELVRNLGIPLAEGEIARDEDEAARIGERVGYPIVLKIVSRDILHKTEAGGVIKGINNKQELMEGYRKIIASARAYKKDADIQGVLAQRFYPGGTEVIVGLLRDKVFGFGIMFGLGGIFTEVLEDVTYRIAPIDEREALKMIKGIKGYRVLQGIRGQPPRDINALAKAISDFSRIGERDWIKEAEINPLLVFEKGVVAVDVRILKD